MLPAPLRHARQSGMLSVLLLAAALGVTNAAFELKVLSSSSPDNPLRSSLFYVTTDGAPERATWFLLENTNGPTFSGLPFWFANDEQRSSVAVNWWSISDLKKPTPEIGNFTLSLSAWTERSSQKASALVARAEKPELVHYDKRYSALVWNATAESAGPGMVRLGLIPADAASAAVAPQSREAVWMRYHYTGDYAGVAQFAYWSLDGGGMKQIAEQYGSGSSLNLSLSQAGLYYVGLWYTASNGERRNASTDRPDLPPHGFLSRSAPLVDYYHGRHPPVYQPLALIVPFANGTVPSLPPTYRGTKVLLPPIPGDVRLALPIPTAPHATAAQVTLFSGGTIFLPVIFPVISDPPFAFIEINLPTCMRLQNATKAQALYTVVPAPTPATRFKDGTSARSHGGTHATDRYTVRLVPSTPGHWLLEQGTLQLWPLLTCPTPSNTTLRLRLLTNATIAAAARDDEEDDNWQELITHLVAPPVPLASPPKRLAPSLTWADVAHFSPNSTKAGKAHSLRMFRNVGMTTIPTVGAQYDPPSAEPTAGVLYSPSQRASDPLWAGLKYAPEMSAFLRTFNDRSGLFRRLKATHAASAATRPHAADVMRDVGGLSDAQIGRELAKLNRSLDFYEATGLMDMAYDGWFFHDSLNVTRQLISYTVPDFWWTDSEQFPEWPDWLAHVAASANAQARRRAGESDTSLAYRMSYEFMAEYNGTVANASEGHTAIGFFGALAAQNHGMQAFPWSIFDKLGMVSQGPAGMYGAHSIHNLPLLVRRLRVEKRALRVGRRMVPWLTVGSEGVTTPDAAFDELIHVFLNGASGFCYFANFHFTDMAYYVRISEVLHLLAPYEDIVLDGTLADTSLEDIHGCVVSALQAADGIALIGVTPLDPAAPLQFSFRGAGSGAHVLVDLASGSVLQRVPDAHVTVKMANMSRSAVLRFAPSSSKSNAAP